MATVDACDEFRNDPIKRAQLEQQRVAAKAARKFYNGRRYRRMMERRKCKT